MSASGNPTEKRWQEFCGWFNNVDNPDWDYVIGECSEVIRIEPSFADPYVTRGSAYVRKDRYDEAIADLNRAVQLEPDNGIAYCKRGLAYLRMADDGRAIADFNYAIRLDEEDRGSVWRWYIDYRRDAYEGYAVRNICKVRCDEAIAYWSQAIELDPAFDSAYESVASAYGIRASEYLDKAEYDKAMVDCFNTVGIGLLRNRTRAAPAVTGSLARWQCDAAMEDLDEAVGHSPKNSYLRRALACLREGELDKAIESLDRAISRDRERSAAYLYRGVARLRNRQYDEAKGDFDEAVRLERLRGGQDEEIGGWDRRASDCDRKGEFDKAIEWLDAAISRDWKNPAAHFYRGLALLRNREYEEAKGDFHEAIWLAEWEQDRQDDEEEDEFGDAEWEQDRQDDEEEDEFGDAVWLDPEDANADFHRRLAWLCGHKYDEAVADLDEAVRRDPQDAATHVCRGIAHIGKGDFDAAIADLDEAIRLDPQDAAAHFCRGVAYGGKRDYDAAIADLDEAIRLNAQDLAADIASLESDRADAMPEFERDAELDPENAAAHYCRAIARLGKAKIQADVDFEEARRRGYPATWRKPASAGPAKEPDRDRINDELSQQADAGSGEAESQGAPATGVEAGEGWTMTIEEILRRTAAGEVNVLTASKLLAAIKPTPEEVQRLRLAAEKASAASDERDTEMRKLASALFEHLRLAAEKASAAFDVRDHEGSKLAFELLERVASGEIAVDEALAAMKSPPTCADDLPF